MKTNMGSRCQTHSQSVSMEYPTRLLNANDCSELLQWEFQVNSYIIFTVIKEMVYHENIRGKVHKTLSRLNSKHLLRSCYLFDQNLTSFLCIFVLSYYEVSGCTSSFYKPFFAAIYIICFIYICFMYIYVFLVPTLLLGCSNPLEASDYVILAIILSY